LIIGANPREVAPVLNSRIGKNQRFSGLRVARIGQPDDQTYKIEELGQEPSIIEDIHSGKHYFSKVLSDAKNPIIIVGDGVLSRKDGLSIQSVVRSISHKYKAGFNVLHNHASIVGALDLGFCPKGKSKSAHQMLKSAAKGDIKVLFLLGADEVDVSDLNDTFIVYIGHHGDKNAPHANVVLPGAAYTEKDAIYINMEGRAQFARAAVQPPYQALPDWQIISLLTQHLGYTFGYHDLAGLRHHMSRDIQAIGSIGKITKSDITHSDEHKALSTEPIHKVPINFYMTDPISRSSPTMAKCTDVKRAINTGNV
jgi:NADH-quinone oxidoreductase subunit G